MINSPENMLKKVARGATYASLAMASFISGCIPGLQIETSPRKPNVRLSPHVECVNNMPRISVKYEADPSVNPVYVRVYDPVARVGNIQKAYLATASHRGTLNFRGIEYPRNNQKEFIAFNNGMEIEISAVERTEYPGTEGGVLVSYFPLGSPTRMVLSC